MARKKLRDFHDLIRRTEGSVDIGDIFLREVERHVERSNMKGRLPSKSFKPSSMHCERNMFYQLRGVDIPDEGKTRLFSDVRMTEVGTDSHTRMQSYLESMPKDVWQYYDISKYIKKKGLGDVLEIKEKNGFETKIYDKRYNLSFQTDGLMYHVPTKKFYIFEFKTETDMKFRRREGVDIKHYAQGTCYALCYGIETGVIFLYESRDMLAHKVYYLPVTAEMKQEVIDKMNRVNLAMDSKKLPPKTNDRAMCRYCNYREYCDVNSLGNLPEIKDK